MGVSIVFYDGVNQIGGNKILIQDNDTKILLDFAGVILLCGLSCDFAQTK